MMKRMIETSCYTSVGSRSGQQDAVYVTDGEIWDDSADGLHRQIAVLCDGMGGMTDGARASETAVTTMAYAFDRIRDSETVNLRSFLESSIVSLDRTIHEFPRESGRGSGTTMVCVLTDGDLFYTAAAGDSRIYFIHGNRMLRLTRDHNHDLRLKLWLSEGLITKEQYEQEGKKEALISFLGVGDISLMDIPEKPGKLISGDMILLCSDGVTNTLSEQDVLRILMSGESLGEMCERIVESAVSKNPNSQDNTSVILLRYLEELL